MGNTQEYHYYKSDSKEILKNLGKEALIEDFKKMLLIRNFEIRAESAYQQGKIGGFFHSYIGQEAIQTACLRVMGPHHWYTTTYRCHALALLLGVTPTEIFGELFGKLKGNAKGRGGSMHLFSDTLLGGFAIVGGHLPLATGAAFSIKYKQEEKKVSLCFLGEGAVAQGAFHESLNLASLWDLPCMYIIENNEWGMGTSVKKAICTQPIGENFAKAYGMSSYTFDGMDYLTLVGGFSAAFSEMLEKRKPILIEVVTQRFKGHSVSDPGFYRSKSDLEKIKQRDPILILQKILLEEKFLSEEQIKEMENAQITIVKQALSTAEQYEDPDPISLGEGVFAPEQENIFGA